MSRAHLGPWHWKLRALNFFRARFGSPHVSFIHGTEIYQHFQGPFGPLVLTFCGPSTNVARQYWLEGPPYFHPCSEHTNFVLFCTWFSLGSRREAFLSQNISTCLCSFTFNPAFHQNSKVFSYNLALPLIYWSSLWFTEKQNWPKHWQEISELFICHSQRVCV